MHASTQADIDRVKARLAADLRERRDGIAVERRDLEAKLDRERVAQAERVMQQIKELQEFSDYQEAELRRKQQQELGLMPILLDFVRLVSLWFCCLQHWRQNES